MKKQIGIQSKPLSKLITTLGIVVNLVTTSCVTTLPKSSKSDCNRFMTMQSCYVSLLAQKLVNNCDYIETKNGRKTYIASISEENVKYTFRFIDKGLEKQFDENDSLEIIVKHHSKNKKEVSYKLTHKKLFEDRPDLDYFGGDLSTHIDELYNHRSKYFNTLLKKGIRNISQKDSLK